MASDTHGIPESSYGTSYGNDQQPVRNTGNDGSFWSRWSWVFFCGLFTLVGAILLVPSGGIPDQRNNLAKGLHRIHRRHVVQMIFNPDDPNRYIVEGDHSALILYGVLTIMCIAFTAVLPVALALALHRR